MRISWLVGLGVVFIAVSGSAGLAQTDHKGLVNLTCVRTGMLGDSDLPEGAELVFRDMIHKKLPTLKLTADCPDLMAFVVRTINTPGKSAAAFSVGIEVYREVTLLGAKSPTIIMAQVWEDDYLWVVSGPADRGKMSDSLDTILTGLAAHLRDEYLLAGNGS